MGAADQDPLCGIPTQGNLKTVNGIDGGITSRGAMQNLDPGIGKKAHIHQVIVDAGGKIDRLNHGCGSHFQFAQHTQTLHSLSCFPE